MLRLKTAALLFSSLLSPAALALQEPELPIGHQEAILQAPPVVFGLNTLLITNPFKQPNLLPYPTEQFKADIIESPVKKPEQLNVWLWKLPTTTQDKLGKN